jgi:hypothetical protein
MTRSEIVTVLTGEGMMTKYTGAASAHHGTRSLTSRTTSMRRAVGAMATMSMTGYPPNGSLHITIASGAT